MFKRIREDKTLWFILLLALAMRVGGALFLGNDLSGLSGAHDEIPYSMLGHRVSTGHGLTFPVQTYPWIPPDHPQSYYSATISLFYGAIYTVFGYRPLIARLITGLLSTAVVGMTYLLALRIFGRRVAVLTGLIAAVYAYLVFYGVTLVTETPFMLALMVALYLAYDLRDNPSTRGWIVLGLALGVTLLLRMAVIFFLPVLLAWVILSQPQVRRRAETLRALIPIVIIVAAVAPFTVRNVLLWDHFMLLESQFGHVFWNGNHPGHAGDFHPFQTFVIPAEILASQNDAIITSTLLQMGIENVLADPAHFIQLTITRLRELFTFWPTSDSSFLANAMRLISFGWIAPLALVGIPIAARRRYDLMPVWLFLILHVGIYSVTWTMIRYRVPLDPFFIMFAALAIVTISDRLRPNKAPTGDAGR